MCKLCKTNTNRIKRSKTVMDQLLPQELTWKLHAAGHICPTCGVKPSRNRFNAMLMAETTAVVAENVILVCDRCANRGTASPSTDTLNGMLLAPRKHAEGLLDEYFSGSWHRDRWYSQLRHSLRLLQGWWDVPYGDDPATAFAHHYAAVMRAAELFDMLVANKLIQDADTTLQQSTEPFALTLLQMFELFWDRVVDDPRGNYLYDPATYLYVLESMSE